VVWPAGSTAPFTIAAVSPVIPTKEALTEGAPAVNAMGAPALAVAVEAEIAAQYWVAPVRPVMLTETLWKVVSVNPSVAPPAENVGEPLAPWLVHQVDVARS
jgi:hypothetical protein